MSLSGKCIGKQTRPPCVQAGAEHHCPPAPLGQPPPLPRATASPGPPTAHPLLLAPWQRARLQAAGLGPSSRPSCLPAPQTAHPLLPTPPLWSLPLCPPRPHQDPQVHARPPDPAPPLPWPGLSRARPQQEPRPALPPPSAPRLHTRRRALVVLGQACPHKPPTEARGLLGPPWGRAQASLQPGPPPPAASRMAAPALGAKADLPLLLSPQHQIQSTVPAGPAASAPPAGSAQPCPALRRPPHPGARTPGPCFSCAGDPLLRRLQAPGLHPRTALPWPGDTGWPCHPPAPPRSPCGPHTPRSEDSISPALPVAAQEHSPTHSRCLPAR